MVAELTAKGNKRIVLNLLEVDHIDSAGIGELVRTHSTLRRQGGQLKLASLSGKVKDVLKMTSLHSVFDIHENEASAVKSFGSFCGRDVIRISYCRAALNSRRRKARLPG